MARTKLSNLLTTEAAPKKAHSRDEAADKLYGANPTRVKPQMRRADSSKQGAPHSTRTVPASATALEQQKVKGKAVPVTPGTTVTPHATRSTAMPGLGTMATGNASNEPGAGLKRGSPVHTGRVK
jgi:hypothetical protein